jgi:hypothetical protein
MIFFTDSFQSPNRLPAADFGMIWEHYHQSNFLYPTKLELLQPVLGRIQQGWPLLLNAPADLFQIHLTGASGQIVSSVCTYRDTPNTFVVQHAASHGQPLRMIDCLQSLASSMSACQEAGYACMFFRLENRWPLQIMRNVSEWYSPEHIDLRTQDYLICRHLVKSSRASGVHDFGDSIPHEASQLAVAALGELRSAAYNLEAGSEAFRRLRDAYARFDLVRDRRIFGSFRDKALAGIALAYFTGFPMNFSSLCGRVEIIVHPNAPDRERIVSELSRATIHHAQSRGERLLPALVDPVDTPAVVTSGFTATGKQYSNFLWTREGARGFASTAIALSHCYGRVERISATKGTC